MARREEGTEPVFERSGESGGYTFTDLHYPRFVPPPSPHPLSRSPLAALSTGLTPTRAHRQPTNCPVTHGPRCVHVIAVTHKVTPGVAFPLPLLFLLLVLFLEPLFLLPVVRAASSFVLNYVTRRPRRSRGWTSPMRTFHGSAGSTLIPGRRGGGKGEVGLIRDRSTATASRTRRRPKSPASGCLTGRKPGPRYKHVSFPPLSLPLSLSTSS